MTDAVHILLAIVLGSVLALLYFGGLWWTVRRLSVARSPSAFYFVSLLLRLAMLLAGFCALLPYSDGPPLVACLISFLGTRLAVVHLLGCANTPLSPVETRA